MTNNVKVSMDDLIRVSKGKYNGLCSIPVGDLPALLELMEIRGLGVRAAMVASEIQRRCNMVTE